jgi:hypothetical protein
MPAQREARSGVVGFALTLLAVALFLFGGSALALADKPADAGGGPPSTPPGQAKTADKGPPATDTTVVTEDNDNDGVPNAPDPVGDADNQHPSGKDKHVEAGGSGNQGKAAAEPDQNGNGPERDAGGLDQPGGPGGEDILDQDGNNGCGNDDDFEDDNEGLCGGNKPPTVETTPPTLETTPPTTTVEVGGAGPAVLGETQAGGEVAPAGAVSPAGALAFTGYEAWPLVLVALGLAFPGLILLAIGRRRARDA